ncbi:aspartate aminotransferase [Rhodobacteraceae bacterium D3-12]|nr:aspartate aminotransferase [Rhodobacteraceae bacterium D3-12]
MTYRDSPILPENWLRDLFACKAVQQGQIVRRKTRDVERYVGMDRFLDELQNRGFRAVENRGQIIVFCNHEPIRRIA